MEEIIKNRTDISEKLRNAAQEYIKTHSITCGHMISTFEIKDNAVIFQIIIE